MFVLSAGNVRFARGKVSPAGKLRGGSGGNRHISPLKKSVLRFTCATAGLSSSVFQDFSAFTAG